MRILRSHGEPWDRKESGGLIVSHEDRKESGGLMVSHEDRKN